MFKGQVSILDFISASVIFIILLVMVSLVFNNYSNKFAENLEFRELQLMAHRSADFLINSNGRPLNWDSDSVEVIGIGKNGLNEISSNRLNALMNMEGEYDKIKYFLGIQNADFIIDLIEADGGIIHSNLPFCKTEPCIASGEKVIVVRRSVLFNDEKANFTFTLWR